jgi:hypothetical protein
MRIVFISILRWLRIDRATIVASIKQGLQSYCDEVSSGFAAILKWLRIDFVSIFSDCAPLHNRREIDAWSLRNHHAITAQPLHNRLPNRTAIDVITLGNALNLASFVLLRDIAAQSKQNLFATAAILLRTLCGIVAISLRERCGITSLWLQNRYCCDIVAQSLWNLCVISAHLLQNRCAIVLQSPRNRCTIAAMSLCNRFAIVFTVNLQSLRNRCEIAVYRCAIAALSLRYRCANAALSLR